MIVASYDTAQLPHTDQIDLLPRLYGQVIAPKAVVDELQHFRAPQPVRKWIENPPTWLEVREV